MREPLANQRHLFEIPDGLAFFNCANVAPQLRSVRKAGERALARNARPWEIARSDWFTDVERLRSLFAQLIRADADGVAIVPSTSYGLAVAALNLDARPGSRVLTIARDFPSAVYTWRSFARRTGAEVRTVEREADQSWTEALLEAIDQSVSVVAVPNVQWTDGSLVDLRAIAERARSVGAALAIDATQSLGAMPLDVRKLDPDFVVSAGYKWLLGPFGLAYLYVAERHRDGHPLEENWILRAGSDDFARLTDYRDEYQAGARRFDVGERTSFTLVPMAIAALEQLLEWQVDRIADALAIHTGRIEREAAARGLAPLPAGERGPHLLGIRVAGSTSTLAPTLAARGVHVGVRAGLVRVAPHLYTNGEDIDLLLDALAGFGNRDTRLSSEPGQVE
jgi:selenocysteine lyase/cysteine desulfurase